ncbi:NUMOD4 motif-containing HNH endonuclease [Pseudomonas sp. GD03842]|uniref:NUMOD4 domain-containing protein n=1 Tax=Pseudomonas sp. GD03842 TaxID=2975385 RepID=UPI00244BFE34|nr:NUMOD4 domain-containing protein [Pseudomonas sp. GD03842]MDH0749524.1 NUMOD4 motif-containing HNH endonuclease [Pseudomonas sp. GD03842]
MNEIWKDVVGFEGSYEVSSHGRVRSLDRICIGPSGRTRSRKGALMTQTLDKGYFLVSLFGPDAKVMRRVHRLVAEAFHGAPSDGAVVNHIDGNKVNNLYTNLEWTTVQGNTVHSYATGLQLGRKGTAHHNIRITEDDVRNIVRRLSNGERQDSIASEFGISKSQVSLINLGKRWEHLDLSMYGYPPYNKCRAHA